MWCDGGNRTLPAIVRGLVGIVVVLAALACATEPAPSAAPTPANNPEAPTPTQTATPFPTPTLLPTPTFLPTPTVTPTITPVPAPTPTPLPDAPLVFIGDAVYVVDLAVTGEERTQGLSGRPSLAVDRGMLFVYKEDNPRTFWMPDMHFPLDMVWIRSDCTVAGVTADVPNPALDTPRDQLPRYPSTDPVRFILEINAGQAGAQGIVPGAPVQFAGQIEGRWGC